MLPLDDPRWYHLHHRGGRGCERSESDPDAPIVHRELAKLRETPEETKRFGDLWPYLCSEGTTWSAAYADVPYVVELVAQLPLADRVEHLIFLGLVDQCATNRIGDGSDDLRPFLVESYQGR